MTGWRAACKIKRTKHSAIRYHGTNKYDLKMIVVQLDGGCAWAADFHSPYRFSFAEGMMIPDKPSHDLFDSLPSCWDAKPVPPFVEAKSPELITPSMVQHVKD